MRFKTFLILTVAFVCWDVISFFGGFPKLISMPLPERYRYYISSFYYLVYSQRAMECLEREMFNADNSELVVKPNVYDKKAAYYYELVVKQGSIDAAFNLANLYQNSSVDSPKVLNKP